MTEFICFAYYITQEKKTDFLASVSWIYVFNNVLNKFVDLDTNKPTDQSSVLKN